MPPLPFEVIASSRMRARAIRQEAAALRAQSEALQQRLQEEYDRARYLRAVTREALHMVRVKPR